MPLPMNFSGDFALWDFTESGTFTPGHRPGSPAVPYAIATALRAQVNDREKSPSGGVYQGFEVNWFLPGPLLAAAGAPNPQPADVWTDAQGVLWTVLVANYDRADQVWQLGTVDLVLANNLRDTVDVQRPTLSYDAAGGVVRHWPDGNAPGVTPGGQTVYAAVPARVQPLTQEVVDERGLRAFRGNYAVILGQQLDLVREDRLKVTLSSGTAYLDVRGTHDPQRIDELPVCDAYLAP